ncbi:MAG: pyridoxal phosphate-dependent aminotransferase [Pseudohongiellaceae bacterium]
MSSSVGPKLIPHPRQAGLVTSATLAINERVRQLASEGKEIFNFGLGQSPFPVPQMLIRALRENAHQKDYLPVRGLLTLRESVSHWFKRRFALEFNPANILIAPGSKELLFLIQMALDCRLILPSPSWVSYHPQSRMAGNSTIWVDTKESDNWNVTPNALRKTCEGQLDDKTGLLLLNYPNNPTGSTYEDEQLAEIACVARDMGILVLSDEIYGEIHHQGRHTSIAQYYPEGSVVTTGLSKWCGAGGWRLGVGAFPEALTELADRVSVMASETYTSTSAPIQFAATAAFEQDAEIDRYLSDSRKVLGFVANYLHSQLITCGISAPAAVGGFYFFCNFESFRGQLEARGISDSSALAEALLNDIGLVTLPGAVFGRRRSELSLRMSYVDFDGESALHHIHSIDTEDENAVAFICPRIKLAMEKLSDWLESTNLNYQ